MVVTGLEIQTVPDKLDYVKNRLSAVSQIKFQESFGRDRIMVVIETETSENEASVLREISELLPVLHINLNYRLFEHSSAGT